MSMIRPRAMPPKPPARPERGTREWFDWKRQEARGRAERREAKRGAPEPARKRLRQRSPLKAKLHALYVAGLKFLIGLDPLCRCCRERPATEGHHSWGQRGWAILLFIPICRRCHDDIENHKNAARDVGLIQYK